MIKPMREPESCGIRIGNRVCVRYHGHNDEHDMAIDADSDDAAGDTTAVDDGGLAVRQLEARAYNELQREHPNVVMPPELIYTRMQEIEKRDAAGDSGRGDSGAVRPWATFSMHEGGEMLYELVGPVSLRDSGTVTRAVNSFEAMREALRLMRERFYRHTCKLHGPMVCDKCEALNALDAALKAADPQP